MRVLVMGRDGIDYGDRSQRVDFDTLLEQSDFVSLRFIERTNSKNDESRRVSENETGPF